MLRLTEKVSANNRLTGDLLDKQTPIIQHRMTCWTSYHLYLLYYMSDLLNKWTLTRLTAQVLFFAATHLIDRCWSQNTRIISVAHSESLDKQTYCDDPLNK